MPTMLRTTLAVDRVLKTMAMRSRRRGQHAQHNARDALKAASTVPSKRLKGIFDMEAVAATMAATRARIFCVSSSRCASCPRAAPALCLDGRHAVSLVHVDVIKPVCAKTRTRVLSPFNLVFKYPIPPIIRRRQAHRRHLSVTLATSPTPSRPPQPHPRALIHTISASTPRPRTPIRSASMPGTRARLRVLHPAIPPRYGIPLPAPRPRLLPPHSS
ncbi:hypothetical protein BD626DRAFT_540221 [Schizophyllum amplum]|uniref:Uncharacterized protein n=1 Tax=Schizophyllum amplum TaxID=97359 RepID=A0A550BZP6_9AGAR|nr:hypothetical protein BD626DRAFT_540221 [Auriculariopsis ampla]